MADENVDGKGEAKKSPLMLIVIILGVLLIVISGLLGWILLSSKSTPEVPVIDANPSQEAPAPKEPEKSVFYPLESFIVNLKDSGGTRYLKTTMELELDSDGAKAELDARKPELKNSIIFILSSKTMDEIQDVDGKIILTRELMNRINQMIKKGRVKNIYFTEFIIQKL
ncbi:MAG: flagellar basal body-associated FliL family protein [Desulfobacterales bacterium]|nr:flagellar basal body-associated FliL family protein [Desulfobacterales bacterium]